jgi:hypothetical protein
MRAIKFEKAFIPMAMINEALGVEVDSLKIGDDTIKCTIKDKAIVYLRCSDLKQLFKLKVNILDADSLKVSKKGIQYFTEKEIFKGTVSKWKKNTKKLAREISQSFY